MNLREFGVWPWHFLLVLLILTACTASPLADSGEGARDDPVITMQPRVALDLADGSYLMGLPSVRSLPVHTKLGRLDVPLIHLATMTYHDDRETVSLHFRDGDKLTGVLALDRFDLETIFGPVSVSAAHVQKVTIKPVVSLTEAFQESLVLYYPFDQLEDTVMDQSGRNNHGLRVDATHTPNGVVNGAYEFNGEGAHIVCNDHPSLDLTTAMTIVCWVRPNALDDRYAAQIVHKASRRPTRDAMIALYYFGRTAGHQTGTIQPCVTIDGKWGGASGFRPTRGVWCHAAVTYDGKQLAFYANGELTGVLEQPGSLATNDRALLIGKGLGLQHGRPFNGALDELMIFNRALSAEQIKRIYDAQNFSPIAIAK